MGAFSPWVNVRLLLFSVDIFIPQDKPVGSGLLSWWPRGFSVLFNFFVISVYLCVSMWCQEDNLPGVFLPSLASALAHGAILTAQSCSKPLPACCSSLSVLESERGSLPRMEC